MQSYVRNCERNSAFIVGIAAVLNTGQLARMIIFALRFRFEFVLIRMGGLGQKRQSFGRFFK